MNAQYKKGVLELCVLRLIKRRDLYGYDGTTSFFIY